MKWEKISKSRGKNRVSFKVPNSGAGEGISIRADLILWGEDLYPCLECMLENFSGYISPETSNHHNF